jgi:hypothetical protein
MPTHSIARIGLPSSVWPRCSDATYKPHDKAALKASVTHDMVISSKNESYVTSRISKGLCRKTERCRSPHRSIIPPMRNVLLMIVLIKLSMTTVGWAQHWPHWRGPTHDGVSLEKGLPDSWSAQCVATPGR